MIYVRRTQHRIADLKGLQRGTSLAGVFMLGGPRGHVVSKLSGTAETPNRTKL